MFKNQPNRPKTGVIYTYPTPMARYAVYLYVELYITNLLK